MRTQLPLYFETLTSLHLQLARILLFNIVRTCLILCWWQKKVWIYTTWCSHVWIFPIFVILNSNVQCTHFCFTVGCVGTFSGNWSLVRAFNLNLKFEIVCTIAYTFGITPSQPTPLHICLFLTSVLHTWNPIEWRRLLSLIWCFPTIDHLYKCGKKLGYVCFFATIQKIHEINIGGVTCMWYVEYLVFYLFPLLSATIRQTSYEIQISDLKIELKLFFSILHNPWVGIKVAAIVPSSCHDQVTGRGRL